MLFTINQQKALSASLFDFQSLLYQECDKTEAGSEQANKAYFGIMRQIDSIRAIIKKA